MKKGGLALIVVIGILGVLAVLAVAFVAMAQLERRASGQRVNAARAYLLARSGIEDALARMGQGQDHAYGGENWDGDPLGTLSSYEAAHEVCHRTGAGTPADVETCPARDAMRPSFFAEVPLAPTTPVPVPSLLATRVPAVVAVDGRDRGYSGVLAGDNARKGNTYALKTASVEGRGFHINGGDPSVRSDPTAVSDYNTNLRRMLGTLAEALDEGRPGVGTASPPDPPRPPSDTSTGERSRYLHASSAWRAAMLAWAQQQPVGIQSEFDGVPVSKADGWALIDARPSTGWRDWDQVKNLALGGSRAKLDTLKPYLTLHAWTDRKVVAPHVTSAILGPNGTWFIPAAVTGEDAPAKAYRSWGEMKLDPDRRETKQRLRAPGFERINGKLVGRAPVDFSWARGRRPALLALLGGLKGLYLDEASATPMQHGDVIGWLQAAEVTLAWNPSDICHKVATWIQASTNELNTRQQWSDFCDALPDAVVMNTQDYAAFLTYSATNPTNNDVVSYDEWRVFRGSGLTPPSLSLWFKGQAVRDILKANFNPNSNLNKFSPNLSLWKTVDKGDLLTYSTEFSFLPVSYGHQEVSSIGRVVDRRGRLLASRVLKALLAGPPPMRLTTQKEFVSEDLGALDIAGDETGFRLPGHAAAPFITASQGSGKTWGHALPGLGSQGVSLQTYPEPVVDDGAWPSVTLSIHPADYDGNIQLATVETAKDDFYSASGPQDPATGAPFRKMMMLARYTGNFDLDQSAADPHGTGPRIAPFHITPRQNHPDFYQVTGNCTGEPGAQKDLGAPKLEELRLSLLDAGKPNTLYPDGCYSEKDRAPEYLDKGNADGFHGVTSFWVKANHFPPLASNFEGVSRGHPFLKWTNFVAPHPDDNPNQVFHWGDSTFPSSLLHYVPIPLGCFFEIGHSPHDTNQEHCFTVGRFLVPHRWELLTLRWDFRAPTSDGALMEMLLNAGRGGSNPSERGTQDIYSHTALNAPTLASDITVDHLIEALDPYDKSTWIYGPHCLSLGRGHPEWEYRVTKYTGSGADATFDEFVLYDFGGAGAMGELPPDHLATTQLSAEKLAATRFPEGRYYKESAYGGLGAPGNAAAEWFSAPLRLGEGPVRLRGIAWTQIVPRDLPHGAISFELVDASGTAYARDAAGHPLDQRLADPVFTPVNHEVSRAFRLHAVFQSNLADAEKENTPILDPLALDDVTVYYEPLGGPRVLSYGATTGAE